MPSWKNTISLATEFRLTVEEKKLLNSLESLLPISEKQTFVEWVNVARDEGLLDGKEVSLFIEKAK